eukprot:g7026.t1
MRSMEEFHHLQFIRTRYDALNYLFDFQPVISPISRICDSDPMMSSRLGSKSTLHAVGIGGIRPSSTLLLKKKSCSRIERRIIPTRAEAGRKTSFTAGFLIGGVVCGVLGFLYAPQISKALLDEQQRLKVLQFLPGREAKPVTRDDVMTRLDELHSVLDNLSQDMGLPSTEPVDKTEAAKSNGKATDPETPPTSKETTPSSPET